MSLTRRLQRPRIGCMATSAFPNRRTVTTIVIVIALLLAPSLALANCCCDVSRLAGELGVAQSIGCVSSAPSASACCLAPPSTSSAEAQQNEGPQSVESGCQCHCDGCADQSWDRADILATAQDQLRVPFSGMPSVVLLAPDYGCQAPSVRLAERSVSFSYSAPQRCAALCRWLN